MRKNQTYRRVDVEFFDAALHLQLAAGERVVVAIDVAKSKFVAALSDRSGDCLRLVKWEHPRQLSKFIELIETVRTRGHEVVVVMEPTGTYGDALRHQLTSRDIEVHRASTKHVHDAAELYDGVPSKHDAKDAAVMAWLYAQGRTQRWVPIDDERRCLRTLVDERDLFEVPLRRTLNKLEATLARHFPELGRIVDVGKRRSLWALLTALPSPQEVAAQADVARALLVKESRGRLTSEVIDRLIEAARTSCGMPMTTGDQRFMRRLIAEIRRCHDELATLDGELAEKTAAPHLAALRQTLGSVTLAVVIAYVGSPSQYPSAAAFQKACGLNLREHSSGIHQGKLRITKRGPSIVRRYLHLAALRLIQRDPLVRCWYERRGGYTETSRMKAVIAVVRKLAKALVALARGDAFDAAKLFDARRLMPSPTQDIATQQVQLMEVTYT